MADRLVQRMCALAVVATVFLPPTFLTRLLGVDLAGIPGADNPWAFGVLCVLPVAVGGLPLRVFRRGCRTRCQ